MKIIGIVAEYNPFHTGHAWHIQETRRQFREETAVVAVMSGNWVQRGECAIADKWTRARAALEGGVDLVLELPTLWAVSSAEGFARGAVACFAAQLDPTLEELGDIKTAVSEAVTNAIVHAYPDRLGKILIKARILEGNILEL